MNRRHFLAASVAGAGALAANSRNAYAAAADSPLRVGLIGCGWYGKTDLFHLMQVAPVDVVAICDVDSQQAETAAELISQRQPSKKRPPILADYRKLLSEHQPEIVLVATPDHWHALPMIEACQSGADIYVQKPISLDVVEGQAMVAAARKHGRTVQVGLQRRSTPHLLEARDRFIATGKLGRVGYVDIHSYYGDAGAFPAPSAPPAHLDWETYVGPAPMLPYNAGIHPRRWRAFREFGNGQVGDLCVHFFDLVRYFLGLGWPRSVSATGGILMRDKKSPANIADTQNALFDFGDVQIAWTQRNWGENPDPNYPWGAILYGDRGTLKLSVRKYDFIPTGGGQPQHGEFVDERDKYPEDAAHKETEPFAAAATRAHMLNFLAARRVKKKPTSDIEEGFISSASCILANLSMDLGRSLEWDPAAGKIKGDEEANEKLARPYRGEWRHPSAMSIVGSPS